MVEIGKRDIVDRNTLAMEPFDRTCSFRSIDFSYIKHANWVRQKLDVTLSTLDIATAGSLVAIGEKNGI